MAPAKHQGSYYCRVSAKGQVTLPAELRQALGIEPKRYVQVEAVQQGGEVVIQIRPYRSGIEQFYRRIKPVDPTLRSWQEVEREAKAERAEHILEEMRRPWIAEPR